MTPQTSAAPVSSPGNGFHGKKAWKGYRHKRRGYNTNTTPTQIYAPTKHAGAHFIAKTLTTNYQIELTLKTPELPPHDRFERAETGTLYLMTTLFKLFWPNRFSTSVFRTYDRTRSYGVIRSEYTVRIRFRLEYCVDCPTPFALLPSVNEAYSSCQAMKRNTCELCGS